VRLGSPARARRQSKPHARRGSNGLGAAAIAAALLLGCAGRATTPGDAVAPAELRAVPGQDRFALVGEEVVLDGSLSPGAVRWRWTFGDGTGWDAPRTTAVALVRYQAAGRFLAVLEVWDAQGRHASRGVVLSVTPPFASRAPASSPIVRAPGAPPDRFAVVVSDANLVAVVERRSDDGFAIVQRIETPAEPRTVTVHRDDFVVACQGGGELLFVPLAAATAQPGAQAPPTKRLHLPPGSRPFGVASDGERVYVSLQAAGALAVVRAGQGAEAPAVERMFGGLTDPRGVAPLPDGRVAVTRWRSADDAGEVTILDPRGGGAAATVRLAHDARSANDGTSGGVPSYFDQVVVSPWGNLAAIPGLHANHGRPPPGNERALPAGGIGFSSTVRAIVALVDLGRGMELPGRVVFDERGLASAAAFSARGDFLFVAMRGNHMVDRLDMLRDNSRAGTFIEAGDAVDGLALTGDDRLLLVSAPLSRALTIYDATRVQGEPRPRQVLPLLAAGDEPLDARVLRGKRLFNDAADARLAASGYVTCAHCHLDGDSDQRSWDFGGRGEGGPLHWSANFDEVQDFEHDLRAAFGGTGLMPDELFHAGERDRPLGGRKQGQSEDLDALAAYVESLTAEPPSPHRASDSGLTAAARRGKQLFESAETGCTRCHAGPRLTDSAFVRAGVPRLHDVGTLGERSGQRLGGALAGIDTPSLHGLWRSAPYLHDGSAATLGEVLRARNAADRHGHTSHLDGAAIDDLAAYLLSLDGRVD
jgi:mono/diheme cytochrome c family protein